MNATIRSIKIRRMVDTDPDFSHIGEFTDTYEDWVIVRVGNHAGEYVADLPDDDRDVPTRGREFRFFKPYADGEREGTEDYKKYGKRDWERAEAYERQVWCFIGIEAVATVAIKLSSFKNDIRIETFTSGGLWGTESDSEESYLMETAVEQLAELKAYLLALGVEMENFEHLATEAKDAGPQDA